MDNWILVVDDDAINLKMASKMLVTSGFRASCVKSGQAALDFLKNNKPNLILLDLKLPGLSGEEVLSTIRKENPFITVIVYTNYSDFADIKRLTNIGIDGYINKGPEADLGELIEAIEKKLAPMDDQTIDLLFKEFPTD